MGKEFKSYFKQGMPPKKKPKPLKRTALKKKYKPTGEKETFEAVLDNLSDMEETRCFVCEIKIALVTHNNFAHVLSKKKYPLFRNNPENIVLLCHSPIARIRENDGKSTNGCHSDFDTKPRSELTHPMWEPLFELEEELKDNYKQLNK